jgi:Arc/MetJ family transcription regulator
MGRVPDTATARVMRAWTEAKQRRSYVKSATRTNVGAPRGDTDVATVEIGLDGRHEALALMAALIPFHSFVVQHGRAHWIVHARVPGCHDETLDELLARIERWASDIGLNDFTCVLGDEEGS